MDWHQTKPRDSSGIPLNPWPILLDHYSVTVPEQYRGVGLDLISFLFSFEAMSYWAHSFAASWMGTEIVFAHSLAINANEEQKAKYLGLVCNGGIGAFALTESGAGSDAMGSMRTTAKRDGDNYILNGSKMFISNGPVADAIVVYARTAPELGNKGISCFIVEKKFVGFSVAQKLDKMGWRGSPTGELVFDNCVVPAANLVGSLNKGVSILMGGLNLDRISSCFHMIGVSQRALDLAIEVAKTREQFGKPIGSFQLVQGLLADAYTDLESMRGITYQLAKEIVKQESESSSGRREIQRRTAAALLHCARAFNRLLSNAVQVHGGTGYILETEVNRLYRTGKLMEIGAGTTQMRQVIIAEDLLR